MIEFKRFFNVSETQELDPLHNICLSFGMSIDLASENGRYLISSNSQFERKIYQ